jgi:hypothetical protein
MAHLGVSTIAFLLIQLCFLCIHNASVARLCCAPSEERTHLAITSHDQLEFSRLSIGDLYAIRDETNDGVTCEFFEFPLERDDDLLSARRRQRRVDPFKVVR